MKNILFWWGIFFALVFCIILSGMVAFGQGIAPAPIEFVPLVDLDAMFDPMKQWFTDILKEYWVMLLSIFFIWLAVCIGIAMLSGGFNAIKAEVERQERIKTAVDKVDNSLFGIIGVQSQSVQEKWTKGDVISFQRRMMARFVDDVGKSVNNNNAYTECLAKNAIDTIDRFKAFGRGTVGVDSVGLESQDESRDW